MIINEQRYLYIVFVQIITIETTSFINSINRDSAHLIFIFTGDDLFSVCTTCTLNVRSQDPRVEILVQKVYNTVQTFCVTNYLNKQSSGKLYTRTLEDVTSN